MARSISPEISAMKHSLVSLDPATAWGMIKVRTCAVRTPSCQRRSFGLIVSAPFLNWRGAWLIGLEGSGTNDPWSCNGGFPGVSTLTLNFRTRRVRLCRYLIEVFENTRQFSHKLVFTHKFKDSGDLSRTLVQFWSTTWKIWAMWKYRLLHWPHNNCGTIVAHAYKATTSPATD